MNPTSTPNHCKFLEALELFLTSEDFEGAVDEQTEYDLKGILAIGARNILVLRSDATYKVIWCVPKRIRNRWGTGGCSLPLPDELKLLDIPALAPKDRGTPDRNPDYSDAALFMVREYNRVMGIPVELSRPCIELLNQAGKAGMKIDLTNAHHQGI